MIDTPYYFTYGSLKRGFPNYVKDPYPGILSDFVDNATTRLTFPLIVQKEPACSNPNCNLLHRMATLVNKPDQGVPVKGEVFRVTTEHWAKLDKLEGFYGENDERNTYAREPVEVTLDNGDTVTAACYFIADAAAPLRDLEEGISECLSEYTLDMAEGTPKPGWKPKS